MRSATLVAGDRGSRYSTGRSFGVVSELHSTYHVLCDAEILAEPEMAPVNSGLVIAAVTAALKRLLQNGLVQEDVTGSLGAEAAVTALPPDRITLGADERPQLNLFLYHVAPQLGLRSSGTNASAFSLQPSALPRSPSFDLRYLVTAYGAQDLQAEVLLGSAIAVLYRNPVIAGPAFADLLGSAGDQPLVGRLAQPSVTGAIEKIQVTAEFLDTETMSRIWSAQQTHYRPSAAYRVGLSVRDSERPQ